MIKAKISKYNDEFDLNLLIKIVKRNLFIIIGLLTISFIFSFFFIRWSTPVYQSEVVIQINQEDNNQLFFDIGMNKQDNLIKMIDFLNSTTFLQKALSNIPLKYEYYSKGTLKDFELFNNSPFTVDANLNDSSLYYVPFFIQIIDDLSCKISYEYNKTKINKTILLNKYNTLKGLSLKVISNNLKYKQPEIFNEYFFIINKPSEIVKKYRPSINIAFKNPESKTIKIICKGSNPLKTQVIVNTLAEASILADIEQKQKSSNNILSFIDNQIEVLKNEIDTSEKKLQNFRLINNVDTSLRNNPSIFLEELNLLSKKITDLLLEKRRIEEIEKLVISNNFEPYLIYTFLSGSNYINAIEKTLLPLIDIINKKDKYLHSATDENIKVKVIDAQINKNIQLLKESIKQVKSDVLFLLAENEKKYKVSENKLDANSYNNKGIEYLRLARIHSINERFYEQLLDAKTKQSIARAGYVSQQTILENAELPIFPLYPISKVIYFLSFFIASLIIFLIIFINYIFYDEIVSVRDITKYTEIPILGAIPNFIKDIPVSQLIVDIYPKSMIAETFRNIRTNLQFINSNPDAKIISITSTISGEGKTFIAINIAGIIAFTEKKVIVIDLDMRKPKIHKGFLVDNNKGMSTIFIGKDKIEDCIVKTRNEYLDIITAGPIPPNPSELLLSDNFPKTIEKLKGMYDYIIIDNPPIGIVTDAMSSMLLSDFPIYILKSNYSKKEFINNIENFVRNSNIKKLSIILNDFHVNTSNQLYKYGNDKNRFASIASDHGYYNNYVGFGYYDDEIEIKQVSKIRKIIKKIIKKD